MAQRVRQALHVERQGVVVEQVIDDEVAAARRFERAGVERADPLETVVAPQELVDVGIGVAAAPAVDEQADHEARSPFSARSAASRSGAAWTSHPMSRS
jgi:hypothetical protein